MSDKPTTSEWTVKRLADSINEVGWNDTVAAINAALASEREKRKSSDEHFIDHAKEED